MGESFGVNFVTPIKGKPTAPRDEAWLKCLTHLAAVCKLSQSADFDTGALVHRFTLLKSQHASQLIYWAVPLVAIQKHFNLKPAAFWQLKHLVADLILRTLVDRVSSRPSTEWKTKKKRTILSDLTNRLTLAQLAFVKTEKAKHALLPLILAKVQENLSNGSSYPFNLRNWARFIRNLEDGTKNQVLQTWLDTGTDNRPWLTSAISKVSNLEPTPMPKPDPSENSADHEDDEVDHTDSSKHSEDHEADEDELEDPNYVGTSSSSSDTDDRTVNEGVKRKVKPHLAKAADLVPSPPGSKLRPKPPRPPRLAPWSTRKKIKPVSTPIQARVACLDTAGLPVVPILLVADLSTRLLLMDQNPRFANNFFGASDVCGNDDQYPTSIYRKFALELIKQSDYAHLPNCIPVTAGKVVGGTDLLSTFRFHCHYAHAVAIVCVCGKGSITVTSSFRQHRSVSFQSKAGEPGFEVIFPGQTIALDAAAREASWCLVGMAVTGTLDKSAEFMPSFVLEHRLFETNRLQHYAPVHPQQSLAFFLRFDDTGHFISDPRVVDEAINTMLKNLFYLPGQFTDILSMDQARVFRRQDPDSESSMTFKVAAKLPSILKNLGIDELKHSFDIHEPKYGNQEFRNQIKCPHLRAFLGGPWTLVQVSFGDFRGYFHAKPGSVYIYASHMLWNDDGEDLEMTISILGKDGDIPAATLTYDLQPFAWLND